MHDSYMINLVLFLRHGRVTGDKRGMLILIVASAAKCVGLSPNHVTRLLEVGCHNVFMSDKGNVRLHPFSFLRYSVSIVKAELEVQNRRI